jgi:hypothetical protein
VITFHIANFNEIRCGTMPRDDFKICVVEAWAVGVNDLHVNLAILVPQHVHTGPEHLEESTVDPYERALPITKVQYRRQTVEHVLLSVSAYDFSGQAVVQQHITRGNDVDTLTSKREELPVATRAEYTDELVVTKMEADLVRQDFVNSEHDSPFV